MNKITKLILLMCFVMLPFVVKAQTTEKINLSNYSTLNLKEALAEEEIEEEFKNYSESDDQITIYLFRGKGCGYCRAFL